MSFEIFPLFSTVVYRKKLDIRLTESELDEIYSTVVSPRGLENISSVSSFLLDNPKLENLKNIFLEESNEYFNKIMKFSNELYITNSWLNVTQRNQQHSMHNHTNSVISGCFYIKASDSQPSISFNRLIPPFLLNMTPTEFNHFNSMEWNIPVEDNMIVIFPSSCLHYVKPNFTENERISIAFNTFVKGKIGAEYQGADIDLK